MHKKCYDLQLLLNTIIVITSFMMMAWLIVQFLDVPSLVRNNINIFPYLKFLVEKMNIALNGAEN